MAQGFDTALYCGQAIELKFYDANGNEWIEPDFLSDDDVLVWRKDDGHGIPRKIRDLILQHGYRIHTDFDQLPKHFRDLLA